MYFCFGSDNIRGSNFIKMMSSALLLFLFKHTFELKKENEKNSGFYQFLGLLIKNLPQIFSRSTLNILQIK